MMGGGWCGVWWCGSFVGTKMPVFREGSLEIGVVMQEISFNPLLHGY